MLKLLSQQPVKRLPSVYLLCLLGTSLVTNVNVNQRNHLILTTENSAAQTATPRMNSGMIVV